ncbi:MAG: hypothetical protein J2P27_02300 [Actinobacteria bacterium]|nr:hypothetical protein [Actinomycetota bacterium]
MTDLKPPRLAGAEREELLALLQFQHDSLIRKVDGVDEEPHDAGVPDELQVPATSRR